MTWGYAVAFAGYFGFSHYLQLASHEIATTWHKYDEKRNSKSKSVVAKLMCGKSNPETEIGRHKNIPRENHFCLLCQDMEVHFILKCNFYDDLRKSISQLHNLQYQNFTELP